MPTPLPVGAIMPGTPTSIGTNPGGVNNRVTPNAPAATPTATPLPAGAKMPGTASAPSVVPNATMTANISSPSSTQTMNPPAVITSATAANDLANKQTQVATLNQNTADQATANATNSANTTGATNPDGTPQETSTDTSDTTGTGSGLDSQVSDLLSSFDDTASTEQQNAQTEENTLGQETLDTQNDLANQYQISQANLASIQSGTYPLTPAESALLTNTAAQYEQAIQFQSYANASYVGQMKEALGRSGLYTSSNAPSLIEAAITQGTQAVTSINNQMGVSLANLQMGFQTQDYNEVQASWEDTASYMQDRMTALQNMQTEVATQTDNMIKEQQTENQDTISDFINSDKFDFSVSDAAIKNALAQGTLDEKTANDLTTQALKAQSNAIAQEKADQGTVTQQKDNAMSQITQAFTAGSTLTDGTPTVDNNNYINPAAWKYVVGEAAGEGITKETLLKEFGGQIDTANPKAYGLSATDLRTIAASITATPTASSISS